MEELPALRGGSAAARAGRLERPNGRRAGARPPPSPQAASAAPERRHGGGRAAPSPQGPAPAVTGSGGSHVTHLQRVRP